MLDILSRKDSLIIFTLDANGMTDSIVLGRLHLGLKFVV